MPVIVSPAEALPEIRLPLILAIEPSAFRPFTPPTVLSLELPIVMPSCPLATAREPSALVPDKITDQEVSEVGHSPRDVRVIPLDEDAILPVSRHHVATQDADLTLRIDRVDPADGVPRDAVQKDSIARVAEIDRRTDADRRARGESRADCVSRDRIEVSLLGDLDSVAWFVTTRLPAPGKPMMLFVLPKLTRIPSPPLPSG